MTKQSNKGRITRVDRAWDAAYREAAERAAHDEARAHGSPALREALSAFERGGEQVHADDPQCEEDDGGSPEDLDTPPCAGVPALLDEAIMPAPVAPEQPANAVTVPLKFIQAALLVAARKDIRYYLNGVYIHAVDGDIRIVATDGHRLVASRHAMPSGETMPEWLEGGVIIPREELAAAMPLLSRNATAGTWDAEQPRLIIEHDGGSRVIVRCANRFASFSIQLCDGKFPDYARVLASAAVNLARGEGEAMQASAIDTRYLKGAAEIAERLGSKAVHAFVGFNQEVANFFTFDGAPDTAYIVMPMRTKDEAVSDGVVKLIGSEGIKGSLAAFRAHITRTKLALEKAKDEKERAMLEDRRASIEAKIAHLINVTTPAARQLEHRVQA